MPCARCSSEALNFTAARVFIAVFAKNALQKICANPAAELLKVLVVGKYSSLLPTLTTSYKKRLKGEDCLLFVP